MILIGVVVCVVALNVSAKETVLAPTIDPISSIEKQQQSIFARIAPAVVFISDSGHFGSGFFVDGKGTILTNAHVVGKSKQVLVILHDGRKVKGKVVELGANETDLALVKISVKGVPFLKFGDFTSIRVGTWVASVGHGRGGVWAFTTGMISNIYPAGMSRPVFQTQIPLNPGSSGGPIVDKSGQVVGIVTAGMTNSNSINFAIKTDYAIASLRGLRSISDTITVTVPGEVAIFVNGSVAGTGPTLVFPAKKGTYEIFAVIKGKMVKRRVKFPKTREVNLLP